MVEKKHVILATAAPMFFDGGQYLRCELTSEGETWCFGIMWGDTEIAMHRCGEVVAAHRDKARNVVGFVHG
jgi:hypothetical protein